MRIQSRHGRKGFVTVNQRLHAVACRQRFGDQPTDDAGEQFQVLCAFMLGLFQVFENWATGGFVHASFMYAYPALCALDSCAIAVFLLFSIT